jgi:hypothetical protein
MKTRLVLVVMSALVALGSEAPAAAFGGGVSSLPTRRSSISRGRSLSAGDAYCKRRGCCMGPELLWRSISSRRMPGF